MKPLTVCCVGLRKAENSKEVKARLFDNVKNLIDKGYSVFLFGGKGEFDSLCHEVVSELKKSYPHIKRIYVRAEYQNISEDYKNSLLESYEDTYFPSSAEGAGRFVYIKRTFHMIENSSACLFYFDETRPDVSGIKFAFDYANKKNKQIINIF